MTSCGRPSQRTRCCITLVAVAGRIVRSARPAIVKIDPAWPWGRRNHHRARPALRAPRALTQPLAPTTKGPEHRQKPR